MRANPHHSTFTLTLTPTLTLALTRTRTTQGLKETYDVAVRGLNGCTSFPDFDKYDPSRGAFEGAPLLPYRALTRQCMPHWRVSSHAPSHAPPYASPLAASQPLKTLKALSWCS